MSDALASFVPSVVIALSVCMAFVAGRTLAWTARSSRRATAALRLAAVVIASFAGAYFFVSRSNRYAYLLPVAFVAGCFGRSRRRLAPGVFDQ